MSSTTWCTSSPQKGLIQKGLIHTLFLKRSTGSSAKNPCTRFATERS